MTARRSTLALCLLVVLTLFPSRVVHAFMAEGCAENDCTHCHTLTRAEAEDKLRSLLEAGQVDRVVDVRMSEIPGLYEVAVERKRRNYPLFIDFSKKYLIAGNIMQLETMVNVAKEREIDMNRIDPTLIPLEDAVVIGNPAAKTKIVVFDDPECPYCVKIHAEMKKAVGIRQDLAFFIKMLPLKIHPTAREKAKAIVCSKSAEMLDDSLAGKPVPEPSCETDQIERNEQLAQELEIRSTPTLVFPDGRVAPGYKTAERILDYLNEGSAAPHQSPQKK